MVQVEGGRRDIWAGVLDEENFELYKQKSSFSLTHGVNINNLERFDWPIQPGDYYLVFSNTHSVSTPKGVKAAVRLLFD